MEVTLTLTSAATAADVVTVSYSHHATNEFGHARPSQSRLLVAASPNPERSETVNPIPSMRVRNDTPPVVATATVNGETLTVTFNALLDGASPPAAAEFSVSGGTIADPNVDNPHDGDGVALRGASVVLNLETAVTAADTVTVSYTGETLRALASEVAVVADFSGAAVSNLTPPILSPGEAVSAGGNMVTLTSNAALASLMIGENPASSSNLSGHTGQFAVIVNAVPRAVERVGVADTTVTLTLAGADLVAGEPVTVSYNKGSEAYRLRTPAADGGAEVAPAAALAITVN
jgi:uncharacterized repeat protein (TIGR02059 family)